jgi:hypothetical protein
MLSFQDKLDERQGRAVRPGDAPSALGPACEGCDGLGVVLLATPAQVRARGAALREGRAAPFDGGCLPAVRCAACDGIGRAPHLSHSDLAALAAD